jgi:hypothetical protein
MVHDLVVGINLGRWIISMNGTVPLTLDPVWAK